MEVRLIARTVLLQEAVADVMTWTEEHVDRVNHSDMLAEFAGRQCYESFHRPNAGTARNEDYVANIISQQHFSVLEHASATFLLRNVSRTLTHELVRHRHLSFSQLSQRYVNEANAPLVVPALLRDATDDVGRELVAQLEATQAAAGQLYGRIYTYARSRGANHKEARGAARSVLVGNTRTSIVVTANMRAWREFVGKRWHVAADPEIRQLAGELLVYLRDVAPATFADVPTQPYGS